MTFTTHNPEPLTEDNAAWVLVDHRRAEAGSVDGALYMDGATLVGQVRASAG